MTDRVYTLDRSELIRGFKSFEWILQNCRKIENADLCAYVSFNETGLVPHIHVGFPVSKKKLKNLTKGTA